MSDAPWKSVVLQDNDEIVVCSACNTAACWQGAFYCERAKGAGTVKVPVSYLRRYKLGEHEDYWRKDIYARYPGRIGDPYV